MRSEKKTPKIRKRGNKTSDEKSNSIHAESIIRASNRRLIRDPGADQELFEQALSRCFARDAESLEKSAALLTACCMISKISVEKIFKNLKKFCSKTSSKKQHLRKREKEKKKKKKQKKDDKTFGKTLL